MRLQIVQHVLDIVTDNDPELIGSDCVNKIKNDILKFSKGE